MIKSSKTLSITMFVLALALGLGSVLLFAGLPLGGLRLVSPDWPLSTVLWWDAALSMLFFVQHSGMIRRRFRSWLGRLVDPRYHGAIYGIASGVALATVVLLWQPSRAPVMALSGLARHLAQGLSLAAFCFFVWGARTLRPFDPLGLGPLLAHIRNRPDRTPAFVARGPYRLVRHPLYLAVLVLIWSCPDVSLDRLLFAALWSGWILLGARLEEADLTAELGDVYREYCRQVPMLVPWPGRRGEGYVVVQLILVALVLFGPRTWPGLPPWPAAIAQLALPVGIALSVLGAALIVAGIAALGRNLAAVPRPKEGAILVERGPYRVIRHPMYSGAILIAFGWALAVHGTLSLAYAVMVAAFLAAKTAREERWLREEVAGYVAYQRRVRKLIPYVY
jgi:methanethiol S-methyltransferase